MNAGGGARPFDPAMVLFDLDGTLADTAPDLAAALNALRGEKGLAPLAFQHIRPIVSLGSPAMLALAFEQRPGHPDYPVLRERFLDLYRADIATRTRLFPGMSLVLDALDAITLPWGIVTNKPAFLTVPLVETLGLAGRARCIVSGDTLGRRKPHPDQLLHACEETRVAAPSCVYVGDARNDVEAGRRAGMKTLVALFGYIPQGEDPFAWGADGAISSAGELFSWLGLDNHRDDAVPARSDA